jgi:hypothetical protein
MRTLADLPQALPALLTRALSEGGDGSFLVVGVGPVYLQFAVRPDRGLLFQETIGNAYLPGDRQLGVAPLAELERLGFDTAAEGNPSRTLAVVRTGDLERIAAEAAEILRHVYGCHDAERVDLDLELEDVAHPENPRLIAAIEALAERESVVHRREVFRELLAAVLLVPSEKGGEAFTDHPALLAAYPDGIRYAARIGIELFPRLQEFGDPSLVLNPAGPTGLHLSCDYVEALARAAAETRGDRHR